MLKRIRLVSLRTRAILFVSLALLPLGLIAIWLTSMIVEDERQASERALIALSEKAAVRERQIIERAIGGAAALATTAHALDENPELCQTVLRQFVRNSTLYGFVAFHGAKGIFECASVPLSRVPATNDVLTSLKEKRIIGIFRESEDTAIGGPSLVVATPVFEDAQYEGRLQLHVTRGAFRTDIDAQSGARPANVITFNSFGDILTSEKGADVTQAELPRDIRPEALVTPEQFTFEAQSRSGRTRRYVVLPLTPGMVYALAAWPTDLALLQVNDGYWRTSLLAVTMWLVSVVTVYLVMHYLVIKGLARLHGQMSHFSTDRALPEGAITGKGELFEMERNFRMLAQTVVREEAELENSVREKNVLLKEVHHRVKNNLQLINSIINMVLRGKPSAETRQIVRRLQDRVMALASVHMLIYQAQSVDRMDAAPIIEEVVNQSVALGLPKGTPSDVTLSLTPVMLFPDQALPLTLLVSEAITNAIKYSGDAGLKISVTLSLSGPAETSRQASGELIISNMVGRRAQEVESTALGTKLMRAFAAQLGGTITSQEQGGFYRLHITFPVEGFSPEEEDAPLTREEDAV